MAVGHLKTPNLLWVHIETTVHGIFQSDIVIRTMLVQGIESIRQSPWLLDYVFAYLPHDSLTVDAYGVSELEKAKDWFNKTEIDIRLAFQIAESPRTPTIAIVLDDSSESGATLGDVSSDGPDEVVNFQDYMVKPNVVYSAFTPISYDSATGLVTLPADLTTANIHESMYLMDNVNKVAYSINSVDSTNTFTIDDSVNANFTNATVISRESFYKVTLESIVEREVYRLELFVPGAITNLIYLHSIVKFILYRYKETLLEGRGFERSTFYSTGLRLFETNLPEIIYTRSIVLSGYVRQYWPKSIAKMIDGIEINALKVIDGGVSPTGLATEIINQGWEMEDDSFEN